MARLARQTLMALALLVPVPALPAASPAATAGFATPARVHLNATQSHRFRAWFTLIVAEQLHHGPNPRWTHRDCAGLVRFATGEALRRHGPRWRHDNALGGRRLPPDPRLSDAARHQLKQWQQIGGTRGAFVDAMALIEKNSVFVSRDIAQARPGDLLFFDQGEHQHLMIWMGDYIAYHTGSARVDDNGLRAISVQQLLSWRDVRWQPRIDNPNFIGVFRLSFLSH